MHIAANLIEECWSVNNILRQIAMPEAYGAVEKATRCASSVTQCNLLDDSHSELDFAPPH
ncbi:hypothetical protein EBL_c05410 [Shimwellia blattae DSM 4481 = NBRC 105725]|uniref:Transposase n=1 Tax=Shimwellia blattae (strain ATCC 29907 / DSM 4481 / JCM 1650 / NBRC 105725 / CDC 9005-74) TaxID=630626 RepID=I2B562_SHIBC|nr:hypothetical protein EBL_c05410 [Shimwellia blattae DSM 4481 = NBRC 105725]